MMTIWGQTAAAQSSSLPPFQCTGDIYQVQSGQLRIFDPITSTYQDIGTPQGSYNGGGYNTSDNYLYASQGTNIIRVGSDGNKEVVFNVGFSTYSGDVDDMNNMYMRRSNTRYTKVNLITGAQTDIDFTGPNGGPADVAYFNTPSGELLIGFSGNLMYTFNITTGIKTRVTVAGLTDSGGYGGTWTDVNGRLLTFNNATGRLWEITDYDTVNPTATIAGQGDPSGNNDGFSCANQPFPNLAPVAFDDDYTTPVNVPVSDNVISNNDNGIDNDPDGGPITVNTTPISGPSNGTVVLNANGDFTYTPATNFIGTDTFVYEIVDDAGLTAQATVTITIEGTIDFSLEKSLASGPNPVTQAGQVLTYEVEVVNIGDIPLTDIDVEDTGPDGTVVTLSNPTETGATPNVPGQLDTGETWTYTYDYTVTQDDIDSGTPLVNAVTATSDETGTDEKSDQVSTPILQDIDYTLTKSVNENTLSAPGLLTYQIVVTNTGTVTLSNAALTDTLTQGANTLSLTSGPTLSGDTDGDGDLDVGEVWTYAATFDATQAEIDDANDIVNTADFTTDEGGDLTASATTEIDDMPALFVDKGSDTASLDAPGLITYTITLRNDGNVSLTNVNLVDTLSQSGNPGLSLTSAPALSGDLDADLEIDVGETWTYTATFAATQDEIDNTGANPIVNDVSVTVDELPGTATASTQTTIDQTIGFSFAKSVDQLVIDDTGTLRYEIPVVNTGNVTLTGITFTDTITQTGNAALPASTTVLTGDTDGDGDLDVGESWLYVITQPVDQGMIDNGNPIENVASFDPDEAPVQSGTATTTITQEDLLMLAKSVAVGEPTSFSAVGDEIDFTFLVTNDGNTTRPGPIEIDDDQIGNDLLCQAGDLLPGESVSCTYTWTAEQEDLDDLSGAITNTATATDSSGEVSDPQQATVTSVQMPEITILKELDLPDPPPNFSTTTTLNYTFTVVNTGNVSITAPITITDQIVTLNPCGPPAGGLAPSNETRADVLAGTATLNGANSYTCTGSYPITAADIAVGSITNVAGVESAFNGSAIEHKDDAIFPVGASPKLALEKTTVPADASFAALGDQITYRFAVTNENPSGLSGVDIIEPVLIDDDKIGAPFVCLNATQDDPFVVGDTVFCEAIYTVTQADLDAETLTNTATANSTYTAGDGSTATVISPPDSVTIGVDLTPSISLAKSVDPGAPDPAEAGDTIPYTIIATNDGEQTLSNVQITDPQLGALSCTQPVTLAPTETLTCTGSYLVTQDNIDDQTVGDLTTATFTNTASVAANDPSGEALTPVTDEATHPLDPALPALTILKELIPDPTANPAYESVDDVLRFRMTVTNTGNTTIDDIEVTDSLVDGTCDIATLAPGAQDQTCLFDYVVTQLDIDNGNVENTGAVTGQPANPDADPVGGTDEFSSPGPTKTPALTVVKDGTLDLGADGVASVGDLITYEITVTNTGNVTVIDTVVDDPSIDPLTYVAADDADGDDDIDTLAPGESAVVTGTYPLDQGDIDLGTVTNSASATGKDPDGDDVMDTSDSSDPNDGPGADDPTITDIPRGSGLTVVKTVSEDTNVDVDSVLTYTYVVTNTGNVTLMDVALDDQHTTSTGTLPLTLTPNGGVAGTLLPNGSATFTATYTVTQDDIDAGIDLANVVTATSTSPAGTTAPSAMDDVVVDLEDRTPGISVTKTASEDANVDVGSVITYTYEVENTGNTVLTNVTLDDQHTSATGTTALVIAPNGGVVASLDPDETATFTATYTVTQEDIDEGADLTNTVTVTSESPDGTVPPTDNADEVVDLEDRDPSIEAIKTVQSVAGNEAGDEVVFLITVENTGNVSLTAPMLTDTLRRADGTLITPVPAPVWDAVDTGDSGVLDVGEDWVYTLTYALTQDDVDAGGITNSVLAEADDPDGNPVTDVSDNGAGDGNDPTTVLIPAMPSLETVKTITSTTTELNGTVRFSITVRNTGNVTLNSVAIASDVLTRNDAASTPLTLASGPGFVGASMGSGEGTLQVDEFATYTATYILTQDDIDAGGITNTATATGTPPIGLPVTDVSDDSGAGDAPTVLSIAPAPSILFDKRLATGSGPTFDEDGQTLDFEFEITNTGNVTLTPPYNISDPLITAQGGSITCPTGDIAPDGSIVCTGSYETTQDDVDNGGIVNVATATVGDADPVTADEPVPAIQMPALALEKDAPSIDPSDFVTGAVVTYTFTMTNTGNTTLTAPITIEDALFDASDYNCDPFPAGGLAPDGVYVCTADYTVTTDDVALAVVVNNATATSGDTTSPVATETIPNDGVPVLSIEKSLIQANEPDGTDSGTLTFDEAGDQLVYQYVVTNAGDIAFARDIEVFDTRFPDPIACYVSTPANPELSSGETATCEATYIVTQDDMDEGDVFNEAYARTEFGSIPTIVLSEPDDVTVTATKDPGVTIAKTVRDSTFAAVGDTLTYDFTVTNTGNQTLTNVTVADPLLPTLDCQVDTLAVDGVLTCSGSYSIDQDDIDAGEVVNIATANGLDPDGDPITPQTDTVTATGPVGVPTLDLEKIANPNPFGAVDSDITFLFRVTNTSIFTASNITVTDELPNGGGTFTCDIGTLAPGEISEDCAVAVTVTQEDVDAGDLTNTARVDATGPLGDEVSTTDTIVVPGPPAEPGIELTKTVNVPATTLGTVVTYTFAVENTGNVSLSGVNIADDFTRNDGEVLDLTTPITLQTSGGFPVGDLDSDNLMDPGEVWTFEATYQITQDDINAGGMSNSAIVFAQAPNGSGVFDTSDDGNDADGNNTDDPTEVPITTDPVLDVEKVVVQSAMTVGETVIFEIRAANRGNVDLFAPVPADTLTRSDGTDISADITGPDRIAGTPDNGDTTLDPGEVWVWQVSYTLTQDDIDAGSISNVAVVTAQDVGGIVVSDTSDNGDDSDGNITNDPTVLSFAPMPGLEVLKVVDFVGVNAGEDVVFTITGQNTGNVTLSDFSIEDTMTNGDGTELSPVEIVASGLTDAGTLLPGETVTYTATYTLTQDDVDSGAIENTATISSVAPTGGPVVDVSDDGDTGDGDTGADPTIALIAQTPSVEVTKDVNIPVRLEGDIFEVDFTMTAENTGNVTLANIEMLDDLTEFLAPSATLVGIDGPTVSGFDVGAANASYDGLDVTNMLADGAALAPGSIGTIELTVRFDASAGSPSGQNTVIFVSDELTADVTAATQVLASETPDIFASKSATPETVILGQTITYTLRFENRLDTIESAVSYVDMLPAGIVYTPYSATATGGPADTPVVAGSTLTWGPVDLAPGGVVTITYQARLVDGPPGEYVNRAIALGPDGQELSNLATATVTRRAEAVFDCTDIIGKVFDDRNFNGYQDGVARETGITDQTYFGGKFEDSPVIEEGSEPGIPNVRLATPNGTLITTDEFGRYSVPCAALPADIGSNFLLKLDTRTLPTGYFVTTENPRVVRVTPGTMTRMNFGATLGNLVEIDLTAPAFEQGGTAPIGALKDYVAQLVKQIDATPSVVQLTYYRARERQATANARLDALEALIRDQWRGTSRYPLTIERIIRRTQ